jgi:hypothetical protein
MKGYLPLWYINYFNTIRIYPNNATKIFRQNLYLQSSLVSDPDSFHLTTINISPIKLIVSPNCLCGESETVHHYLLQCPNYEEEREGLRTELYCATGSLNLDLDTLLSFGKDDQYNSTRDTILQILGEFINKTKRFQLCSSFNHF